MATETLFSLLLDFGQTPFSEHAKSICFVFSANQINFFVRFDGKSENCRTAQRSQFLALTKRILASGDENGHVGTFLTRG